MAYNDWVADLTTAEAARMSRYSTLPQDYKNLRAAVVRQNILAGETVTGLASHTQAADGGIAATITGKTWAAIEVADALARGVID